MELYDDTTGKRFVRALRVKINISLFTENVIHVFVIANYIFSYNGEKDGEKDVCKEWKREIRVTEGNIIERYRRVEWVKSIDEGFQDYSVVRA